MKGYLINLKETIQNHNVLLISLLLVIALAIRILYVLPLKEIPFSDMKSDEEIALNVIQEGEYIQKNHFFMRSFRSPGLVFYLIGVYKLVGWQNYLGLRMLQAVLGTLLCYLSFITAQKIFGVATAWVTLILTTFSESMVFWIGKPSTEFLFS